ncbi:PLP-dependent aminotransferase family protein [Cardiobacteriaceae bacterium TAE3-ERU3]|nr:PLP-dependent aminotransferase family protein [Cardiobacteriaceae bacterium TAE3-ERU3]
MDNLFSDRIKKTKPSFIREILKVTANPDFISFAGGLPQPALFPYDDIARAAEALFAEQDRSILQYSTTEGSPVLRQYIANRYKKQFNIDVDPSNIIITTGSQQALDLLGKVFINTGDKIVMEDPGYLGAIQAFSMYEPEIRGVPFKDNRLDLAVLENVCKGAKFFYSVPTYQNPTGFVIDDAQKQDIAAIIKNSGTYIVEDDPYGNLTFEGTHDSNYYALIPDNTILLGSFSKIVAPSLRIGWIAAPTPVIQAIAVAKQAADLHSSYLSQALLVKYLQNNDLDAHIRTISQHYKNQRDILMAALQSSETLKAIKFNTPAGGMFLWAEMPHGQSSKDFLEYAFAENVIFVPGEVFAIEADASNTLRINFSYLNEAQIREGVARLERAYKNLLKVT